MSLPARSYARARRVVRSGALGLVALLGVARSAPAQPDAAAGRSERSIAGERAAIALPRVAAHLERGENLRIVAFGSSSTQGTGASSPAATYPAQLERELNDRWAATSPSPGRVTVVNRGVGGDDAVRMARRLWTDVLPERPDLVIWQTGSNDPITGVTVERFVHLTREGIAAIRSAGADVVLMDQQWCRRFDGTAGAEAYLVALRTLAAELGVPVIQRHALMQNWASKGLLTASQLIGPDGFHMTDASYRQLAKAVAAQVLSSAGRLQPALASN